MANQVIPPEIFHVTSIVHLPAILKDGLIPQIGPRSIELGEDSPLVYFFTSKEALDTGLGSWLGDCFDEDDDLVIMTINTNQALLIEPQLARSFNIDPDCPFEITSRVIISSQYITNIVDEYSNAIPFEPEPRSRTKRRFS